MVLVDILYAVVFEFVVIELASVIGLAIDTAADAGACSINASADADAGLTVCNASAVALADS